MSNPLVSTEVKTRNYFIDEDPSTAFAATDKKTFILKPTLQASNKTKLPANSTSLNQVVFQTGLTPSNCLDSNIYVEFPSLEFKVTHAALATALPMATNAEFMTSYNNFEGIALRNNSLINLLVSGIQVSLNGKSISNNLSTPKIMDMISKMSDSDYLFNSYDLGSCDIYPLQEDYKRISGGILKPVLSERGLVSPQVMYDSRSPFISTTFDAVSSKGNARRPMFRRSTTVGDTTTSYFIIDNLTMQIPLSIFNANASESRGFYGVNKLNVSFQFKQNVEEMFSILQGSAAAVSTIKPHLFTSISISNSETPILNFTQRAVSNTLSMANHTADGMIKSYDTTFRDVVEYYSGTKVLPSVIQASGVLEWKNFTVSPIMLSSVPETFLICVRKTNTKKAGNLSKAMKTDVSALVKNLVVKIGGAVSLQGSSVNDVTLMTTRNGLNRVDYNSLNTTHGNGYIIINSRDLSIPNIELLNTQTVCSLDISFDMASLTLDTSVYDEEYSIEVYGVSEKILSFDRGSFTVNDIASYLDSPVLSNYLSKDQIAYRNTKPLLMGGSMHGGSLLSAAMDIGKYGYRAIKSGIKHGPAIYNEIKNGGKNGSNRIAGSNISRSDFT